MLRHVLDIVDVEGVHTVRYNDYLTLHMAQHEKSQEDLQWCEGFIFLLSPGSLQSTECMSQLEYAFTKKKHIFLVLIDGNTKIPDKLKALPYADFSQGASVYAVQFLLNSILLAEREMNKRRVALPNVKPVPSISQQMVDLDVDKYKLFGMALESSHNKQHEQTLALISQIRASGHSYGFINLDLLEADAKEALEIEQQLRDAEREYVPIAMMMKYNDQRQRACQAFRDFHKSYPDYDPENLARICLPGIIDKMEWCQIPAGQVMIKHGNSKRKRYDIANFEMGKYPVTTEQYAEFASADDGYVNEEWWSFSIHALKWRRGYPQPHPSAISKQRAKYPCVNVSWYEVMAFCKWLTKIQGVTITLPTDPQWQRAAQGDAEWIFPWGNEFDKTRCNTAEGHYGGITPVDRFPNGVSSYGLWDMGGNTWEWCLNNFHTPSSADVTNDENRVLRGGCYMVGYEKAKTDFRNPQGAGLRLDTVGFRLVRLKG